LYHQVSLVTGSQFMSAPISFANAIAIAGFVLCTPVHAQHPKPYAGEDARAIKSLSDEEVQQYLSGAGMGYAKAAELNQYPGPMHALELAEPLELTPEQRRRTEALMQAHKNEARALGRKVVDAERALDALFRSARVSEAELAARVRAVAAAQGEYRLSHLETHRRMKALLTPEQVAGYDRLRGYQQAPGPGRHKGH
jgi:Spy/CpxP family protein refolding chaperone